MTRIGRLFECLKQENRKGLIAYLTAGDPSPLRTPALVAAMVRGGADLIELGVPFSDPIADGPVIQRGGERALKAGTTLATVLEIARQIRASSEVPLLLFTYLNPVLRYGLERLAADAAASGIDGCLLIDASVEEAETYVEAMHAPRPGYRLSGGAYQHGAPSQTGGPILHGFCLSGFAHGCHRRAGFALGVGGPAGSGGPRGHGTPARRWFRHLYTGARGRTWTPGGGRRGGQRVRPPDRAERR